MSKDKIADDQGATAKNASGLTIFLLEELTNARLRCAQLKRYIDQAMKMIEGSKERDHFFEVAGQLIHGVPETIQKLEVALDATALAASRLDYEELKQELRPEKLAELENMIEDVRIRYLSRRSTEESMPITPKSASEALILLADEAEAAKDPGVLIAGLIPIISRLESSRKTASTKINAPKLIRVIAQNILASKKVNKAELLSSLRQVLASTMVSESNVPQEDISTILAASDKKAGFFDFPPDLDDVSKPMGYLQDAQKAFKNIQAWADRYYKEVDKFPVIGEHSGAEKAKRDALRVCHTVVSQAKMSDVDINNLTKHLHELSQDVMAAFHDPSGAHGQAAPMEMHASQGLFSQVALEQMVAAMPFEANSREKVKEGFKEANPDMSDEDLEKAADAWEKNKNNFKEASCSYSRIANIEPLAQSLPVGNSREEVMKGFKEFNPTMSPEDLNRAADEWEKNKDVVKEKTKEAVYSYLRVATTVVPGKWYKQEFRDKVVYFLGKSLQKNEGVAGTVVTVELDRPRSTPKAKKDSVPKSFMRLWKEVPEHEVPANVKSQG